MANINEVLRGATHVGDLKVTTGYGHTWIGSEKITQSDSTQFIGPRPVTEGFGKTWVGNEPVTPSWGGRPWIGTAPIFKK